MGVDGSHNSNVPAPFLTKTYEMVDDPATDDIVSWSEKNSSFVVWNVADFTKDLLPQYFKHNNFSSFVRQLNTYGFHKIDPDRQEFANEGFTKGNKEALKNIHRRKPSASHGHLSQKDGTNCCNDPAHADLEGEIQKLREDKGILINELTKARKLQKCTETELGTVGHRVQALEEKLQKVMTFLKYVIQSTQFMHHTENLISSKKRRIPEQLTLICSGDSWQGPVDSWVEEGRHPGQCSPGDTSGGEGMSQKSDGVSGSESLELVFRQFTVSSLNQSDENSPSPRASSWEMQSKIEFATKEPVGDFSVEASSELVDHNELRCEVTDKEADVTTPCTDCSRSLREAVDCDEVHLEDDLVALNANHNIKSSSEAVICPELVCEAGNLHDHNDIPLERKASTPAHAHTYNNGQVEYKQTGLYHAFENEYTEGDQVNGSNDLFWESMLTESPKYKDNSNQRWFL
ncbi:hypothetical protein KP509_15G065200 [Ceratopteris richardii]|nr:hypothetical protein KP509_15G065200 [Ceratopteris richardii]KAH7405316.1 hypothetical protein KP509_15G065200 [Ceratopteris richardii]